MSARTPRPHAGTDPLADVDCVVCHACCRFQSPLLIEGDDVPHELVELTLLGEVLRRHPDGSCIALEIETGCCTIYERRPDACRRFERGSSGCLDARARLDGRKEPPPAESGFRARRPGGRRFVGDTRRGSGRPGGRGGQDPNRTPAEE